MQIRILHIFLFSLYLLTVSINKYNSYLILYVPYWRLAYKHNPQGRRKDRTLGLEEGFWGTDKTLCLRWEREREEEVKVWRPFSSLICSRTASLCTLCSRIHVSVIKFRPSPISSGAFDFTRLPRILKDKKWTLKLIENFQALFNTIPASYPTHFELYGYPTSNIQPNQTNYIVCQCEAGILTRDLKMIGLKKNCVMTWDYSSWN